MNKFGGIEILTSTCDISTLTDGRGGIFTWIPQDEILEFNMLFFLAGKHRGNHYHPEFIEYFLVVEGSVALMTKDLETGNKISMLSSKGLCFRIPIGVSHAFHAITESTCISFLTKPWGECTDPIINEKLL